MASEEGRGMAWAAAQTLTKREQTGSLIIKILIDCSESDETGPYGPSFAEKCIDLRIIMCFSELKLYSSQMTVN